MKITNVAVFVELDNSNELRQLLIKNGKEKVLLIALIEQGTFHDGIITISEKVMDSIVLEKKD